MKKNIEITMLTLVILLALVSYKANAESNSFDVCPLCTNDGTIICPVGYKVGCKDEAPGETEPRCLFLGSKYIPGCWKYEGIEYIDFSLSNLNMPPSTMVKINNDGVKKYTLNREIVGCTKL